MLIGIPKEIKPYEFRVSITPTGVRELGLHGHQCIVESNAGIGVGFTNDDYRNAGAWVADGASEVYSKADMIVKVKEPQLSETAMLQEGQIVFSYLHLAAASELTDMLLKSGCIAIAYETITSDDGSLPLLAPMSEVAGRVAIQTGVHLLEKKQGGRGVLLSGVPGVPPGKVTILGGGVVGLNAAVIAAGMGADVVVLERSIKRIRELEWLFGKQFSTLFVNSEAIEEHVMSADLVVGAVLIPGGVAPRLVTKELIAKMKKGAVIVDVAVDQGGCIETIKPTTHDNPTYEVDGVIHYGVTNMPSAVANTSTRALENATLPFIIELANSGYRNALRANEHFRNGLNIYRGRVTHEAVARDLNHAYTPPNSFLGGD